MSGHHPHEETTTSPYAARIRAIEALLVEKGILTEPEVQDRISYMEVRSRQRREARRPCLDRRRIQRTTTLRR